jgi:hypothetical protein
MNRRSPWSSSAGGLERFLGELGRLPLSRPLSPAGLVALADRYDSVFHPVLIPELVNPYGVQPRPPSTVSDRAGPKEVGGGRVRDP